MYIPFAKHTMWKKAIIKGTLDSCREVHEDMVSPCLLWLVSQSLTKLHTMAASPRTCAYASMILPVRPPQMLIDEFVPCLVMVS